MTGIIEQLQAHLAELEQRVFSLEARNKILSEVVVDPEQQDIMGDGGTVAKAMPAYVHDMMDNKGAPEHFYLAGNHPAFAKLKAIVGNKVAVGNWEMWRRLVKLKGWRVVIKAAGNIDPMKRWPDAVEQIIKEQPSDYANVV